MTTDIFLNTEIERGLRPIFLASGVNRNMRRCCVFVEPISPTAVTPYPSEAPYIAKLRSLRY